MGRVRPIYNIFGALVRPSGSKAVANSNEIIQDEEDTSSWMVSALSAGGTSRQRAALLKHLSARTGHRIAHCALSQPDALARCWPCKRLPVSEKRGRAKSPPHVNTAFLFISGLTKRCLEASYKKWAVCFPEKVVRALNYPAHRSNLSCFCFWTRSGPCNLARANSLTPGDNVVSKICTLPNAKARSSANIAKWRRFIFHGNCFANIDSVTDNSLSLKQWNLNESSANWNVSEARVQHSMSGCEGKFFEPNSPNESRSYKSTQSCSTHAVGMKPRWPSMRRTAWYQPKSVHLCSHWNIWSQSTKPYHGSISVCWYAEFHSPWSRARPKIPLCTIWWFGPWLQQTNNARRYLEYFECTVPRSGKIVTKGGLDWGVRKILERLHWQCHVNQVRSSVKQLILQNAAVFLLYVVVEESLSTTLKQFISSWFCLKQICAFRVHCLGRSIIPEEHCHGLKWRRWQMPTITLLVENQKHLMI